MKEKTLFQRCEALGECRGNIGSIAPIFSPASSMILRFDINDFDFDLTITINRNSKAKNFPISLRIIEHFEKVKEGQKPKKLKKKQIKKLKKRVRANDIAIESLKTKIAQLENIVEHSGIQKIAFDNLTNGKGDEMAKGMLEKFGFEPEPEPFTLYAYGDGESVAITYDRDHEKYNKRRFLYEVQCIDTCEKEVFCADLSKVVVGDVCGALTKEGIKLVEIVGVGQAQPNQDAITAEGLKSLGFEFDRHDRALGDVYVICIGGIEVSFYLDNKVACLAGSEIGTFTTLSQIERLVTLLKEVNP